MKLTNITPYLVANVPSTSTGIAEAMAAAAFAPTGPTQERSVGWVPPRAEHGALVESVGGHWFMRLMIETRSVPADAIRREVDAEAARIEKETGRKPGKKERRDLKEDARMALLPHAFPKQCAVGIWLDPERGTLAVDTTSQARADIAITELIRCAEGLVVAMPNTESSPTGAMAGWLASQEAPDNFTVDRECELRAADESKAVIRYTRHALDTEEISAHVRQGKFPTRVAMTWNDRVSFVLTDSLRLKKLAIMDVVVEGSRAQGDGAGDAFDADAAITSGELAPMLADLFAALGGLQAVA